MNLLTMANPKTVKGEGAGYLTGILHLKPDYEICPNASKGCMAGCLNTAGRGAMNSVQSARARRTVMYKNQREAFMFLLVDDIRRVIKRAEKKGLIPCIRLNGTSDINWRIALVNGVTLFDMFPDVQFYDYTPNFGRMLHSAQDNYHLTFSKKEDNDTEVQDVLDAGFNVAVVFRDELPEYYMGYRVIDGDASDLRFLDGVNVVVGLKAKGKARKDMSGFVVDTVLEAIAV